MSGALPGPSERTPTYGRHASAPHLGLTRSPYALEDEEDEEEDDNEDDEDDDDEEGDRVLVGSVQDEGEPAEASEAHSHGGFGKVLPPLRPLPSPKHAIRKPLASSLASPWWQTTSLAQVFLRCLLYFSRSSSIPRPPTSHPQ